jgi:PleD family two-component response regulator
MTSDYNSAEKFKALAPILEDYTTWFGLVAYAVAYPNETRDIIVTPVSFEEWVEKAKKTGDINDSVLRDITDAYEQMVMEGRAITKEVAKDEKPTAQEFCDFKDSFNSYLRLIRRLERDSAMEGSGVDEETGLRIAKAIKSDMKRELERLSRQGTAFCQVMLRIDRFAGQADQKIVLSLAVKNIKKTMRPFDDAYYLGNGHFLISMKQTETVGAEAGVNRLRMYLNKDEENIMKMTASFCIIEPVVGDDADSMIKNMQQDLNDNMNEKDAVLKFKEISDLERFVGTMN